MTAYKLTWETVRAIRRQWLAGATQTGLARRYGVSIPAIHYVVSGQTWREDGWDDGQGRRPSIGGPMS